MISDTLTSVVSEQGIANAMFAAAAVMSRLGGSITVATERRPTGVPDEMITTAALVTWMSHGNRSSPQAEHEADLDFPQED